MHRVLASASVILLLAVAPAFAQQGTTPDGRPMDPTGIQNKTPDGRPINPEGISSMKFTAEEEKAWFDKPVYSSDGTKIGNVAAFARGTDNSISELHADIGGFLGLGETRVRVMPAQFKLQVDRVVLDVTATQAKNLPKVMK